MTKRDHRFPQFQRGHAAGITATITMFVAVLLAAGVTTGQPASASWLDMHDRARVELDAIVVADAADRAEDRALLAEVVGAKETMLAHGRNGKPPARRIDFRTIALREARRAGIRRPGLFVRQIAAESGMRQCARSGAGAVGIAQIMPATARSWRVDPYVPHEALRAAATHMARYERQYGSYRLALAAYNAGPGAVRRYGGVPPYAETRAYIRRVMNTHTPLAGLRQVYHIPQGYTPKFRRQLGLLRRAVARRGGQLRVEDGWRSYEDSLRIWTATKARRGGWQRASAWAAPPGCSNHTRGTAADLLGSIRLAHRLAPRFGLVFPMAREPWHIELQGIATQSR